MTLSLSQIEQQETRKNTLDGKLRREIERKFLFFSPWDLSCREIGFASR